MMEAHVVDINNWLSACARPATGIEIESISARVVDFVHQLNLPVRRAIEPQIGYIAGAQDGLLTRNGVPSVGEILCMNTTSYRIVYRGYSLANGHWIIDDLEPSQKYLVMGRDVFNKEYEPFAWDYVTPATDLTPTQQQELWQSWQTSP